MTPLRDYITELYGADIWEQIEPLARDIREGNIGRRKLAKMIDGLSVRKARNIVEKIRNPEDVPEETEQKFESNRTKFEFKEDGSATVESDKSGRIKTLDDLIREAKINTDIWKIERHIINKWEVAAKMKQVTGEDEYGHPITEEVLKPEPLFQVKAWLKPRMDVVSIRQEREDLIADIKAHAVSYEDINYIIPKDSRSMYEISIFDPHVGKLAWHEESGQNYNSKIAAHDFLTAFKDLLSRIKDADVEEIIVPIGNDALHIDNKHNTTTAGTPQDVDSRYQQIFRRARQMYVEALELASTVAPVRGIIVPGNHDEENIFYLGDSLEGWFSRNPNVTIDNEAKLTKYYRYGQNLTMFNHGNEIKFDQLPFMMAVEQPELWSNTTFREVHVGHFHSRQKMLRGESEDKGVIVRVIPSLSATDAWHKKKGYLGNIRAAQGFRYDYERGIRDIYQYNFS